MGWSSKYQPGLWCLSCASLRWCLSLGLLLCLLRHLDLRRHGCVRNPGACFECCTRKGSSVDFRLGTLLGTNISPTKALLKMIFLFPRWDMLVPWRVDLSYLFHHLFLLTGQTRKFQKSPNRNSNVEKETLFLDIFGVMYILYRLYRPSQFLFGNCNTYW